MDKFNHGEDIRNNSISNCGEHPLGAINCHYFIWLNSVWIFDGGRLSCDSIPNNLLQLLLSRSFGR